MNLILMDFKHIQEQHRLNVGMEIIKNKCFWNHYMESESDSLLLVFLQNSPFINMILTIPFKRERSY